MSLDNTAKQLSTKTQSTLLFVDDEANILSALKRLFRPLGYQIITAQSAKAGLEVLTKQPVDLVISDMRMPEMDGASFLKIVTKKWPDTTRILLTGYADITATIKAVNMGEIYRYISKPWEENDIILSVKRALEQKNLLAERKRLQSLTHQQNKKLKTLNTSLENKVKARTGELEQTVSFLELAHQSLDDSYQTTIEVFANLIAMRKQLGGDNRQVAEYAVQLGKLCHLDELELRNLRYAALLRNIGKLGLADNLLNKPLYSLSKAEYQIFIQHPAIAQGVLMALESLHGVAHIIYHHHEQVNGKGYPEKLKAEQIPMLARLLKIVGDYHDLQQGLLIDSHLNELNAYEYLEEFSGSYYDEKIVKLFKEVIKANKKSIGKVAENCLKPYELTSGMVLSRDLKLNEDVLLLSKGYSLTETQITRIYHLSKTVNNELVVYIQDLS